jgi:ATP-dependent helicase/nuclease subunit A
MISKPLLPETERAIRIEATSPGVDAWVSANAGSGKTSILRNRVIRLLLDGVPPDRILCLTFTKAAAAEMQGRIFEELAQWVALDDAALAQSIAGLVSIAAAPPTIRPEQLTLARTLFARAIEAPGGLKIQTIHAFAERVLHLFPLEAGVPLDFTVLSEPDSLALRHAARQDAIETAIREDASPLGRAFSEILAATGMEGFARALDAALGLLSGLAMRDEAPPDAATREAAYRQVFAVPAGETPARIAADFDKAALPATTLGAAAEAIRAQKKPSETQLALAADFEAVAGLRDAGGAWVAPYLALFLTGKGTPRKAVFPVGVTKADPEFLTLEAEAKAACCHYLDRTRALHAFNRSLALLIFAEAVLIRFRAAKQAENALDFDDLIAALRRLLLSGQSSWIMLKLDAAIEHVLVDEAQDTTRAMWDIVRGLTEEFFAGEGKARRPRSIFVVGDEKQSIFSFQGADPAVFEESRLYFASKSLRPQHLRKPVALNYSFRSSTDILEAVDAVFSTPERGAGLTAEAGPIRHIAAKGNFPGLVELWPPERPTAEEDAPPGTPRDAAVKLAARIAGQIAGWLKGGECHLADGKRIEPGDIVILVRNRGRFFSAMLRALKLRGIPVSGADRLKLQSEPAIRDLLVIAEAVLLKADDMALATALRTPLFALGEAELERLARGRTESLWARVQADAAPGIRPLAQALMRLHTLALTVSPFEFLTTLLHAPAPGNPAMNGRQALLTRLGSDAADPIDAFLAEALAFTQGEPGALMLFVLAQRTRESVIKRDLEQGSNRVRVMTVHGAKGLEGRIVFLGDTVEKPESQKEAPALLLHDPAGTPLIAWSGGKAEEPEAMHAARRLERRKLLAEYRRLLYVGMTRAADRLYIAGSLKKPTQTEIRTGAEKAPPEDPMEWSWYDLMRAGLETFPRMVDVVEPGGEVDAITGAPRRIRRRMSLLPPAPPQAKERNAPVAEPALPAWLLRPAPETPVSAPPIRPSQTGFAASGTSDPAVEGSAFLRRRGILLHGLYESLPDFEPVRRAAAGCARLARLAPALPEATAAAMVDGVIRMLETAEGQRIFGPNSRAEVAISGTITLPDGSRRPIAGRIDRLIVRADAIEIVDLKTGRPRDAAAVPGITRQMALYRAVRAGVLWTETGGVEPLPDAALDAALGAITRE